MSKPKVICKNHQYQNKKRPDDYFEYDNVCTLGHLNMYILFDLSIRTVVNSKKGELENYIDIIKVISLKRSTGRRDEFTKMTSQLKFEFVDAIDGSELTHKSITKTNLFHQELPYTSGAYGCALSHLSLWGDSAFWQCSKVAWPSGKCQERSIECV